MQYVVSSIHYSAVSEEAHVVTLDDDITIDDTAAPFLLLRLAGIAELAAVFCTDD